MNNKDYIGMTLRIEIDREFGTKHPKHGFIYPVNYGYVPNTISGDGEELDAYLLGVFESDYYFSEELMIEGIDKNGFYNNFRDVRWICEIPSEKLSKETKWAIAQPLTLFKVNDEAKEEILSFIL